MSDLIAKRYVKALISGSDKNTIESYSKDLSEVASAFSDEKFKQIISSFDVSKNAKEDLILSFIPYATPAVKNLVKLLSSNKRLEIIPSIASELKNELAIMNGQYEGVVYTNQQLSNEYVSSIEEKFSQKLGVKLNLTQEVGGYNGIKVDVDSLGIEIGFSKDRLKSQMIDHILKAV